MPPAVQFGGVFSSKDIPLENNIPVRRFPRIDEDYLTKTCTDLEMRWKGAEEATMEDAMRLDLKIHIVHVAVIRAVFNGHIYYLHVHLTCSVEFVFTFGGLFIQYSS